MKCKCCGVKMARNWANGYCFHCDWHLGEGYTKQEIHQMIEKSKKEQKKEEVT